MICIDLYKETKDNKFISLSPSELNISSSNLDILVSKEDV